MSRFSATHSSAAREIRWREWERELVERWGSREGFLAHKARAQARELAFGKLREARIEHFGDRAAEHPVAEEFEALVVLGSATAVGQRLLEQGAVAETVAEPPFEGRRSGQGARR